MTNIVTVDFRGDTLFGFEEGGRTFIALKPIAEGMGVNWEPQRQRVQRDPVLSEGASIMKVPFGRGGAQDTLCLPLELLNGWLFGIDSNRIKDEDVRQKVLTYQRECYRVLHDHFLGKKTGREEMLNEEEASESEGTRLRLVTEGRQTFGTQAAAQLWFQLGLPIVPAMLEQPRQTDLFSISQIKHSGSA